MNHKAAQILLAFIHPSILASDDARLILRAQVAVMMTGLSLCLLPIPMVFELLEFGRDAMWIHVSNVILLLSAVLNLYIIKFKGRVNEVVTLFVSACVLSVFITAHYGRGLADSSLTWIVLGPYAASLLGSTRSAVTVFLVGVLGVIAMALISSGALGITPPSTWDPFRPTIIIQVLLPLIFSAALAVFQMVIFTNAYKIKDNAQRELMEERQKLFHTQKLTALGEMAGGIAHEINNPIHIIKGRASVLKRKIESDKANDPQDMKKGIESILKTTERISTIVNTMRRITKMNALSTEEMQQVSITSEINDAIGLAGMKLQQHEVNLKLNLPDEDYLVLGHQGNIAQVTLSLMSNAIDAIKHLGEKWIEVSLKEEGDSYILHVSDAGPGIPKDVAEKIFQPFFTTKPTGQGTGMGLGICLSIISEMKGTMEYKQECEHTTFEIKIPKLTQEYGKTTAV